MQALSRTQLYHLVWTYPRIQLAERVGVSDVAIAKTCRRARIPVPPRGYWERLRVGRQVRRPGLPPRDLGENPILSLSWQLPEDLRDPHPKVGSLVDSCCGGRVPEAGTDGASDDETAVQVRRLLVLNALCIAAEKAGAATRLGNGPDTVGLTVGDTPLTIAVDPVAPRSDSRAKSAKRRIGVAIRVHQAPSDIKIRWEDESWKALRARFADVFAEIAVSAERLRRYVEEESARVRERRLMQEQEAGRQLALAREREEQERLAAWEQQRVDALIAQTMNADISDRIRTFVEAARTSLADAQIPARWRDGPIGPWLRPTASTRSPPGRPGVRSKCIKIPRLPIPPRPRRRATVRTTANEDRGRTGSAGNSHSSGRPLPCK